MSPRRQQRVFCFAKPSSRSNVNHHNIRHVIPGHLLPELRREWVRKGLGREGKGKSLQVN